MQSDPLRPTLGTHRAIHPDTMLRIGDFYSPNCSEAMARNFSRWEREGRLEYVDTRLHRITPQLKLLCGVLWISSLDLSRMTVTNEVLSSLQVIRSLLKLDLSYCRGLMDLLPISHIKTLEVVKLSGCRQLDGVGNLGRLPNLKELELRKTAINDEELQKLRECRTLVKVDLSSCKELTNVNPLSSIATLEVIKLSWCRRLKLAASLGKIPNLMRLDLRDTAVSNKELESLTSLRGQLGLPPIAIKFEVDSDDDSCVPSETEEEEERDFYRDNTWLLDID